MKCQVIKLIEGRDDVTLTTYIWDDSVELLNGKKRPAIVICPGGAYLGCGDREGEPIALAFARMGYNAFVLRYSVLEKCRFPQPMREIALAFACINKNAEEWFVDVNKIAVCGFSAGGHNAAMYSVYWNKPVIKDFINDDSVVLKPCACVIGYPLTDYVYMRESVRGNEDAFSFFGNSNRNFIGEDWDHEDKLTEVSPARLVNEDVPPTFIWTTAGDNMVPCVHSTIYATALAEKKIPFELHVFEGGDHGMALCDGASAGYPECINEIAEGWVMHCKKWIDKYMTLEIPSKPIWMQD